MTKNKEYFLRMVELNKDLFERFRVVHDLFAVDPEKNLAEFNEIGREVMDVIYDWENKLCSHSESGQYGKFSNKLVDKFWEEIRATYPKIDYIGVQ